MHHYPIYKLPQEIIRDYFHMIPDQPKQLFARGDFPTDQHFVFLTVVGSRRLSHYGKQACQQLISGLRGYPIVIVSGLAAGIDTVAHESALDAGLITIAFPGSGLHEKILHPRSNIHLTQKILESGGCLVSEFSELQASAPWTFPQRNRLMAGISRATLLIEATHKSGSRITTRLATEYNRDVLAVPGDIFRENSQAPNELIRMGATPITNAQELLEALGFQVTEQPMLDLFSKASPDEQNILKLLASPMRRGDLIRASNLSTSQINILISQMEMKGLIKDMGGELRRG
jgi:DNA processing protein